MISQVVAKKQDLTHLSWAKARVSSGTAGSFLKSYDVVDGAKVYYKLSDYDVVNGIVGHECVNELVVDRLLEIMGVEHLRYQLVHADVLINGRVYETWLNATNDFKRPGEGKIAFDAYYELERKGAETPLEFCMRHGWDEQVFSMLVVDYLILNRDRHGANIEVLRNPRSRSVRLAPLFDHGLSLMFRARTPHDIDIFDPMADLPVQCFFGSHSTQENLGLIPADAHPKFHELREVDRTALFEGLDDATTSQWREKVWQMIWGRWQAYEALRTQRR